MSTPITKHIAWGKDLPCQLVIKDKKIVHISDGAEVSLNIPDGTLVNVVPHECLKRIIDEWQIFKNFSH